MFNKALKYLNNDKPEKALKIFKQLPEYKEVLLNTGTCYKYLRQYDKARECYLKAADSKTPFTDNTFSKTYPKALNNLGLLAYAYEQDDAAIDLYRTALASEPLYYDALWNLSNSLLRKYCSHKYTDLKTCWDFYEFRFKREIGYVGIKNKKENLITWNGIDHVKSLVVLAEQGFGDQIMFGRYIKLLEPFADKIIVQCHERAEAIFDRYETCRDPSETDATHGIPICSLGKIFNTGIPNGEWITKNVSRHTTSKLEIGVTWSGSGSHANNANRSTGPGYFRTLREFGNLYTLNPTENNTPGFISLKSGNWGETIEELKKLDLVISVDTSIVHLCGALGKPCWVLMPLIETDFRWGDSSMGSDNIWYPSVKVFRNPGNWSKVFEDVANELKKCQNALR